MAQIQSKRDDKTLRSVRDQRTCENLEELEKKKLSKTRNEFRCDCPSCSDSQVVRKKVFPKNLSKRSGVLSKNRKNNKLITTTQSRREFRAKYDNSYQDVVYTSLCDKPRVLEKSVKTTSTIKNQDTTMVKSVEIIKSFPKSCCSAVYREPKPTLAKRSDKLELSRGKKYAGSSSSLSSSPVDESSSIILDYSSIDGKSDNQRIKKRKKKSERFHDFNSSNNVLEYLNEQTYRRTAKGNRSQEAPHKRQELFPSGFENRETTHKVKSHQMQKLPHDLPYENSRLDRILQNQESEELVTCIYDKTGGDDKCLVFENCPQTIHQENVKNGSLFVEHHQQNKKTSSSLKDDDYAKIEELMISSKKSDDSSFNKSYNPNVNLETKSPQLWQKFQQNLENISTSYRELESGLKEMRKEVTENEKPESREFEIELAREDPIKKFWFETLTVGDDLDSVKNINKPSKKNITDASRSTSSQGSQNITSKIIDRQKGPLSEENIHPTDDVINLTNKLMINQDVNLPSQLGASLESCRFEFCKCDLLNSKEPPGRNTSPLVQTFSISREPSRERIKRHDFSLPKIVIPESSERSDLRKIFIYPSEESQEPPLTVYRTSSFVNCKIKENKNIGFRYVLTYVQKYVSPTWKPDEQNKRKDTSQENVKTDDHG